MRLIEAELVDAPPSNPTAATSASSKPASEPKNPAPPASAPQAPNAARSRSAAPPIIEAVPAEPIPQVETAEWRPGMDAPEPPATTPWRPDADPFAPAEPAPTRRKTVPAADFDDEPLIQPRKRKKRLGLLIGLIVTLLLVGVGSSVYFYTTQGKKEEKAALAAAAFFKENQFNEAAEAYEALSLAYPKSPEIERYRFFAALSRLRVVSGGALTRNDPLPVKKQLDDFVQEFGDSTWLGPEFHQVDLWQVTQKLTEDVRDHARDRVREGNLEAADASLAAARELQGTLNKFRPSGQPPESVIDDLEKLAAEIQNIRKERKLFADAKDLVAKDPSAANVEKAMQLLRAAGLEQREEAKQIRADAEARRVSAIEWVAEQNPIPSEPLDTAPRPLAGPLLMPRLDKDFEGGRAGIDTAVLSADGVLYALDWGDGKPLWATRVGSDIEDPPARIGETGGLLLVVSSLEGVVRLTARTAHTGQVNWHQLLPTMPCGRPLWVADRLFVPLADDAGTVLEFDPRTGERIGRLALNQPLARGGGTVSSEQRLLILPVAERSIALFEVPPPQVGSPREPLRKLPSIETAHPLGSLRTTPRVLLGAAPVLVVMQTDGASACRIRGFSLPDGRLVGERSFPGWPDFAPTGTGERFAFITDRGAVGLFGINQDGNEDAMLFVLAPDLPIGLQAAENTESNPQPSLVVSGDELALRVLRRGELITCDVGWSAEKGVLLNVRRETRPLGTPLQPISANQRGDRLLVVTRTPLGTVKATCLHSVTGELLWERQAGINLSGPAVPVGDDVLFLDRGGNVYRIDARVRQPFYQQWRIEPGSQIGGAFLLPDGEGGAVVCRPFPKDKASLNWRLTRYHADRTSTLIDFTPSANAAGAPLIVKGELLLPLLNGEFQSISLTDGVGKKPSVARWFPGSPPSGTKPLVAILGTHLIRVDEPDTVTICDTADVVRPLRQFKGGLGGTLPPGPITAGPFVIRTGPSEAYVAIEIARRTLVVLDPNSDAPIFQQQFPAPLSAAPEGRDGILYIPLQSGVVRRFHLASKMEEGRPIRLPPGTTAAAGLIAPALRWLPLNDGTFEPLSE